MKTQARLLAAGSPSVPAAGRRLVIEAGGQMRMKLALPGERDVELTPVTIGRAEITPIAFVPGIAGRFALNALSLSFADFSLERPPFARLDVRSAGVHLREPVDVWGAESRPCVYTFKLRPGDVTFYGAALVNGALRAGDVHPAQGVTCVIDLNNDSFSAGMAISDHDILLGVGGMLTITIAGTATADSGRLRSGQLAPGRTIGTVASARACERTPDPDGREPQPVTPAPPRRL